MQVLSLSITRADGTLLLGPLDLELPSGGRIALIGESGSGKSLLLQAFTGTLRPGLVLRGRVEGPGSWAWVPQGAGAALHPFLPVSEQVSLLACVRLGLSVPAALGRALPWMERLGLPTGGPFLSRRPAFLSGGERQRVALVQALTAAPAWLLLDEPTASLDLDSVHGVEEALASLGPGTGWLWVTHDLHQALRRSQEVLALYGGQLLERRTSDSALRHPYARRLLQAAEELPDPEHSFLEAPDARGPGCAFAPRCSQAQALCQARRPPWTGDGSGHLACWVQAKGAGGENRSRPAALAR